MSAIAAEAYRARFRSLLEHVDAHLDEELGLEQLSQLARCSKFHFQRQFGELFGLSVHKYVLLSRLKRAAYQLAFRQDQRVVEIALASGYESPEAFARAFKSCVGQTPSEFRKQPQWDAWQQTLQPLKDLRRDHMSVPMTVAHRLDQVELIDFQETRVATLEHRGDPALIGDSIRTLIEWRKANRLPPSVSATFNLAYNDPASSEPGAFRMGLCVATNQPVAPNPYGIIADVIPAGRCARLRHLGSDDQLEGTLRFLYAQWLPQSGEEPRDFPLFFQRVRFFPDVPEHEAVTDIFLPLK